MVAKDAQKTEPAKVLEEERLNACAQLVYSNTDLDTNVWIGDEVSIALIH